MSDDTTRTTEEVVIYQREASVRVANLLTTLTECQASMFDGECVHPRCPVNWKEIKGGADPSVQCPLPWHRSRDGEDDA